MASSTATRVSIGPVISPSLMPVRNRFAQTLLVVGGGFGESMNRSNYFDEAVRVVMEWEWPEPSKISNCEPGIAEWAILAWLTGITESRVPQINCTGTDCVK